MVHLLIEKIKNNSFDGIRKSVRLPNPSLKEDKARKASGTRFNVANRTIRNLTKHLSPNTFLFA
jgi:hypothetical protein